MSGVENYCGTSTTFCRVIKVMTTVFSAESWSDWIIVNRMAWMDRKSPTLALLNILLAETPSSFDFSPRWLKIHVYYLRQLCWTYYSFLDKRSLQQSTSTHRVLRPSGVDSCVYSAHWTDWHNCTSIIPSVCTFQQHKYVLNLSASCLLPERHAQ